MCALSGTAFSMFTPSSLDACQEGLVPPLLCTTHTQTLNCCHSPVVSVRTLLFVMCVRGSLCVVRACLYSLWLRVAHSALKLADFLFTV